MRPAGRIKPQLAQDEIPPWLLAMARFVEAETCPTIPAYVPEITLRLAPESVPLWERIERDRALRGGPPYWALAWAAGLALARHVLDHPDVVTGKRVLDFAAGSGLVGIAAAKSGAAQVIANDIDPLAAVAISLNAGANDVDIMMHADDLMAVESRFDPSAVDVILVGDAFYDHDLAVRAFSFLQRCHAAGCRVLIGDPGRADFPTDQMVKISTHAIPVTPACQYVTAAGEASGAELQSATVWTFAS